MKKALPIGVSNYESLKSNDYYSVDKTLMIKEFLERKTVVTLITRPRRFGKTLNMSMLSEFFDITKDSKDIFKDTKIMKTEYACDMNKYPTIFISFAGAKNNKESVINCIKQEILREYRRYKYVLKNLDEFDQPLYDNLKTILLNNDDMKGIDNALSFLMRQLEEYYHKKVMLFIDEYDTPFIEAHVNGFYKEIKGGLSSLLHNALKDNNHLQYAMMTGIQRVAKENIFSDLNNLVVYTVSDLEYSKYFGFTKEETKELLEYYELALNDDVQMMYDGYHIGNEDIYNPWSIINYASAKKLEPYWINTSANKMIKKAMENSDISFKQGYEFLIKNGYLETQVLLETSFYEASSTEALWGLFINAGYLTIEKQIIGQRYRIIIPNREVQEEFKALTADYLNISNTTLNDLFYALQTDDKDLFKISFQNILSLPSYYDLKDGNSYHMMMLGVCAWLSDDYKIISNREVGNGRCDIILKPKRNNLTSYIFEFKYTKKKMSSDNLKDLAHQAIQQIIDQHYDEELENKVILVGLAHSQKEVMIEWYER